MAGKSFKKKVEPATSVEQIKNISTWKAGLIKFNGRPPKFPTPDDLLKKCTDYFNFCDDNPLCETDYKGKDAVPVTIYHPRPYLYPGLAVYLGVSTSWLAVKERNWIEYTQRDTDKLTEAQKIKQQQAHEFLKVLARIRDIMYTQKYEYAAVNMLNTYIISRELGLRADDEARSREDKQGDDSSNQFANIVVDAESTRL